MRVYPFALAIILTGCSGPKMLTNEPLPKGSLEKVYSHIDLVSEGIAFNKDTFKFWSGQKKYSDKRIQYSYKGASEDQTLVLSSTTICDHEEYATGYMLLGKRNYINYIEKSLGAELRLIENDWLLDPSYLYNVYQNEKLTGYSFVGAKACTIYEITLVNLDLKENNFKRLITKFNSKNTKNSNNTETD